MSKIKGKNTKPEILVRKYLFSKGFRFRLHDKRLPGRPDVVFSKFKTIVFVHGCYWHGHKNCRYFSPPKSRTDWWMEKINKNKRRDNENAQALRNMGWNVIVVWECELKPNKKNKTLSELEEKILKNV